MTKKTYLIIKLEIKADADIDNIITEIRTDNTRILVAHPDIIGAEIVGSSDGLIFD